jgi:hypothetical protein
MNINLTIPEPLLARFTKCQEFRCWAGGQDRAQAESLERVLIELLEENCECIEADMMTDDAGNFLADRLWIFDSLGGEK